MFEVRQSQGEREVDVVIDRNVKAVREGSMEVAIHNVNCETEKVY